MALDKTKLPPGAVIIIIGPQSLEDLETSLDTQVSGNLSYDDKAIASLKNFTFNNHKFNVVRNYDHFKQIIPYILKDNNLLYYKEEDFISKSLVPDYKEPSASKKGNRKELMIEHVCSILEDRKQKGKDWPDSRWHRHNPDVFNSSSLLSG